MKWMFKGFAAVLLTAVVVGVVFSPLLLIGWLIWRLARGPSPGTRATAPPAATMAG